MQQHVCHWVIYAAMSAPPEKLEKNNQIGSYYEWYWYHTVVSICTTIYRTFQKPGCSDKLTPTHPSTSCQGNSQSNWGKKKANKRALLPAVSTKPSWPSMVQHAMCTLVTVITLNFVTISIVNNTIHVKSTLIKWLIFHELNWQMCTMHGSC